MRTDHRVTIDVTARYSVPPARVFAAWLDPQTAGRWLFATALHPMADVTIDARVAGAFRFVDRRGRETTVHAGRYLEIAPPWRLVFALAMDAPPGVETRVQVAFAPRASGCQLGLTHEGLPAGAADRIAARWTGILYGLGETLDAGSEPDAIAAATDTAASAG